MNNLHERALTAAQIFVKKHGYKLLDEPEEFFDMAMVDYIEDEDVLVLVKVYEDKDEMPHETPRRKDCEVYAAKYLVNNIDSGHNLVGMGLRFDTISFHVLDDDKALLAHHINCLG